MKWLKSLTWFIILSALECAVHKACWSLLTWVNLASSSVDKLKKRSARCASIQNFTALFGGQEQHLNDELAEPNNLINIPKAEFER